MGPPKTGYSRCPRRFALAPHAGPAPTLVSQRYGFRAYIENLGGRLYFWLDKCIHYLVFDGHTRLVLVSTWVYVYMYMYIHSTQCRNQRSVQHRVDELAVPAPLPWLFHLASMHRRFCKSQSAHFCTFLPETSLSRGWNVEQGICADRWEP